MSEINNRIRSLREGKNLTRKAFAELIDVSISKLQSLEDGRQRVDHNVMASICKRFDVSANWLLLGGVDEDAGNNPAGALVQIPRYSVSAQGGNGGSFVSEEMAISYYAFNLQWIKRRGLDPSELQIIEVRGDSMEPKFREGDLILIDRAETAPRDGKAFVVRVWDDLVVKNVQIIGQKSISLLSANPQYPPRELKLPLQARDFEIIGRVVASMHEW